MKPAVLLAFVTPLLAQPPTVDNAKLGTRALSGTLAAELSRAGAGPFRPPYSEPKSAKGPVEILVIDHIQAPSEN